MAQKTPLSLVKDKFGDKAKLVAAVETLVSSASEDLWVARTNKNKGLAHVSNAKLLKLHATFSEVKEKFGTRDKLVASILELEKRAKDEGYKSALSAYPVPRLYDLYKSTAKRHGVAAAAKAPKAARAAKAPAAAKPAAKKAAAAPKKTAAKKA
jgi:hypothetical protein